MSFPIEAHRQLAHWAQLKPDHRAVVTPDRSLSFAELNALVVHLSLQLRKLGVCSGGVVAFQLPNIPEAFGLYLAVIASGAIALPLLPALREHDLSYMLRESSARWFVTLSSWRGEDHLALARKSCDATVSIALLDAAGILHPQGQGRGLVSAESAQSNPARGSGIDAVCAMIFTSGTSGRPKAVLYSHRSLAAEGADMAAVDRLSGDDVLFVPPTIAHVSGICFGTYLPLAVGCTVCLLPVWGPDAAVDCIEREGCTWTAGATPFLQGLVNAAEARPTSVKSLRVFRCGGASVPPSLVRRARDLGIDAYRSFGLSEHPTISGGAGQDAVDCIHADGIVHPRIEVIVVDPADVGRRLPAGAAGEIAVRGPDQAVGYLRVEDTQASRSGPWLLTGDIGTLSARGLLTITGRKKDMIIRKGENISARELEDLVAEMAGVDEVAVIGLPDAERGELVCCVVVLRPLAGLSLIDLCAHLSATGVAPFKWPERLERVAALPRNPGGKVLKTELRRMFAIG